MTRLLVTGDRDWTNRSLIYDILYSLVQSLVANGEEVIVSHGDAEGADKIAGWAAIDLSAHYPVKSDPHPAQWYRWDPSKGQNYFFKGAGPERNDEMLGLKDPPPSLVLAFHNKLDESKGTKHCVLGAIKRHYNIRLFCENGLDVTGDPYATVFIEPQEGRPNKILEDALHRLHPHSW